MLYIPEANLNKSIEKKKFPPTLLFFALNGLVVEQGEMALELPVYLWYVD